MCENLLFIFKLSFTLSLCLNEHKYDECACVGNSFDFSDYDLLCYVCLALSCLEQTTQTHISVAEASLTHCLNTFVWNMFSISKHIIQFRWYAFQCIYAWDKNTNVIKHYEWCDYYLCSDNTRLDANKTVKESKGKTLSISIQTQFSIRTYVHHHLLCQRTI